MTAKTRRRVFLALLAVALTLPAESILLKALSGQTDAQMAEEWVASLSEVQLESAGRNLRGYSAVYRRQILKRAAPQARVVMMRAHIDAYIDAHPEMDGQTRDVLEAAKSVISVGAVSEPTAADQESARAVGHQVEQLLGRDTAAYLLVWFGPSKTSFLASVDPLRLKLARIVRHTFTASAFDDPYCDCVDSWGCSSYGSTCQVPGSCRPFEYFPQCGWFYMENCNGLCVYQ